MATNHDLFWDLAEPLLAQSAVERSTMMGHDCLRAAGNFFAMVSNDGALIVKLPADRVADLIDGGSGTSFAPAGKVFREWLAVSEPDPDRWALLMEEARKFAA